MKVKDLIECLHQCNPEAVVLQGGGDVNGYFEVEQIRQLAVYPNVHKDGVNGHYDEPHVVDRRIEYSDVFNLSAKEVKRLKKIMGKSPILGVII